jgi:hypothetical protein
VIDDRIDVRGKAGRGGSVLARADAGDLAVGVSMRAEPTGAVQLEAPAGDLTLAGRVFTGSGCIGLAVATCGLVP